jgi:hypothetical protein
MMKKLILFFAIFCFYNANSQILKLEVDFHSIGIQVILPADFDPDLTSKITLKYRQVGSHNPDMVDGFEMSRLKYDSINEFRGSLFLLNYGPPYYIEVSITDSIPTYYKKTLLSQASLKREDIQIIAPIEKYVSPKGSDTFYTLNKPGSLVTLLSNPLQCGTTIYLLGGTYSIGELTINFKNKCPIDSSISIKSYFGDAIFDGGDYTNYTWIKTSNDSNIYFTTINENLGYNALCLMDTTRLYPYAFLSPPSYSPNYPSLSNLGYDQSGYYRRDNLVFIKTLNNKNPNNTKITFSKYLWCLTVNGNNNLNAISIQGIKFKNYNKGRCDLDFFRNPTQCYPSWTIAFNNTNNVLVENCNFEFTNFPVSFNGLCNYNTVRNCTIKDGTGYWSHGAFKQTRDQSILEYGSYGRYLENAGISFRPNAFQTINGNSIYNNNIRGVVSGIVLGSTVSGYKITESNIYNNNISYCYDGIDVISLGEKSGCMNTRIWGNKVAYCPVAFSLLSPSFGPTYIFRNIAHHISDRKNHNNDVFFMDCENKLSTKIWGTGLKLNGGSTNNPNAGNVYLIHNTFHSTDELGFSMYLWNKLWKKLYCSNNIFYSEGISSLFFDGIKNDTNYSFESISDNYFNKNDNLVIVQPVNGIPYCENYKTTNEFNTEFKKITLSNHVLINGTEYNPDFTDIKSNVFSLKGSSKLIDLGILIPGFNTNFENKGPDIGAIEYFIKSGGMNKISNQFQEISIFPNPFVGNITINSKANFIKFEIYNLQGSLIHYESMNATKNHTTNLNLNSGIYFIKIFYQNGNFLTSKILKH